MSENRINPEVQVKPISLTASVLIFGVAGLLFLLVEQVLVPVFAEKGLHPAINFLVLGSPHVAFFAAALIAYRKEGGVWSWHHFCKRFRLHTIKGKTIFLALLYAAISIGSYVVVFTLGKPLVQWVHDLFPPPVVINEIMGKRPMFVGFELSGNWWLLGLFFIRYFFNVMGEELLWRGYLFPRQELTHGKHTWVVHGLLWTGFHLFAPYNALMVLPGALFMSYIVQRYRNTSFFIVEHALMNAIPGIGIVAGIMG